MKVRARPPRTYGAIAYVAARRKGSDPAKESGPTHAHWRIERLEPHVSIKLKALFTSVQKGSVPPYAIAALPSIAADIEWFLVRFPLEMSQADRARLRRDAAAYRGLQADLEKLRMPDWTPPAAGKGLKPGQQVRVHQMREIEIVRRRGSLLVGDIGGLGKSYTAAGFLAMVEGALPAAVVCETHLQSQWCEKIETFTHLKTHFIRKAKPYALPPADVYVFRVSQLAGWVDYFRQINFRTAVFDEPQFLRTGADTAKGMAALELASRAAYRLGLSGTPTYNWVGEETWNVMQFIDASVFGEREDFLREWCFKDSNGHWRPSDPEALGAYMRETGAYIRHTRQDLAEEELARLPKIPPVEPVVEHVPYDTKAVETMETLARRLSLRMSEGSFVERGRAARELDILARQATGVAKARGVANFVRLLLEGGEPRVVLWGWHREVYRIWNEELKDFKPAMYTGSESPAQKDESKRKFIAGESRVLIMSLRSGAGVDGLQHCCSVGVFGELDWSPLVHLQCKWRLEREGLAVPGAVFFMVTDAGSDPPMMETLGIKRSDAAGVFEGYENSDMVEAVIRDSDTDQRSRLKRLAEHFLRRNGHGPEEAAMLAQSAAGAADLKAAGAILEPA